MKHAGKEALRQLESVLVELRSVNGLKEKSEGVFYWRSRACLHFHEDPGGLFADLRLSGDDFTRWPVNTAAEQRKLVRAVQTAIDMLGTK